MPRKAIKLYSQLSHRVRSPKDCCVTEAPVVNLSLHRYLLWENNTFNGQLSKYSQVYICTLSRLDNGLQREISAIVAGVALRSGSKQPSSFNSGGGRRPSLTCAPDRLERREFRGQEIVSIV